MGVEDRDWFREEAKARRLKALRNGLRSSVPNQSTSHRFLPRAANATTLVVAIAMAGVFLAAAGNLRPGVWPSLLERLPRPLSAAEAARSPPVAERYDPNDVGIPFPPSGLELRHVRQDWRLQNAPLTINATSITAPYVVVRVYSWEEDTPIATIYLASGAIHKTRLAPGRYRLREAEGRTWHGDDKLFGPTTSVSEMQVPLTFSETSRGTMGHIIWLRRRIDGNLPERPDRLGAF